MKYLLFSFFLMPVLALAQQDTLLLSASSTSTHQTYRALSTWNNSTSTAGSFTSGTSNVALSLVPTSPPSANTILAAPSGAPGNPTFRALNALDLPSGISASYLVDGSNNVVATGSNGKLVSSDPIAVVPLVLRCPVHAYNSTTASNVFQDTACTTPAIAVGDPIRGVKDAASGAIIFTNASSTATLRYVNGFPVIHFPGGSNSYLKYGTAGSPVNLSLANTTICVRYQIAPGQSNGSFGVPGVLAVSGTNDRDDGSALPAGSGIAWFLDQPNTLAASYVWKQTGMATTALTVTGSTTNTYVEGLNVGTIVASSGSNQQGSGAYVVLGCRIVFGVTDYSVCDIEGVFVGNNLSAANVATLSSFNSATPSKIFIATGDSLTQAVFSGGVLAGQSYPSLLKAQHPDWLVVNNGYFGATLAAGAAQIPAASNEAPMLIGKSGIVSMLITTNDINSGIGPSAAAASIFSRCDTIYNGSGAQIFVDTVLPRDGAAISGTFEAARQAESVLLLSATAQVGHHYTAINTGGAQGTIGWDGVTGSNPADSTLYFNADQIHLNASGYSVLETLINNGVLNLLNGSNAQKLFIQIPFTLTSGSTTVSNAFISGSNCIPVDNASSLTNVGSLTVTTSGTTATLRSTNVLDTSAGNLFVVPKLP